MRKSERAPTVTTMREVASVASVAWAGAFLEWVDFYCYALLAAIVASHFFPAEDPLASLLASFAALAVGFLFRPLGAIIFGKIGDQYGRKVAFLIAVLMMLWGTLGIGLLPTYATVGIAAAIGVFVLRIIQGLALGGGFGAAITYLGEYAPEHRRGFITGFLFTTAPAGMGVIASILLVISSLIGPEAFTEWGWRLSFIIAGLAVFIIAVILHLLYRETPVFSMLRRVRRVTSAPIRETFSRQYIPLVLLAWVGVTGAHAPIWYTNHLWNSYYMQFRGVDVATASLILSTAIYAAMWMYPLFGWISDKIGRRPILLLGIYGNASWMFVVFWLYDQFILTKDITMLWLLTYSMTLFNGIGYSGAMSAWLLELFPAKIRVTSVALAYNLGYGVTGGMTPFIITAVYAFIEDLYLATVLWAGVAPMIMGLLFLLRGRETLGFRMWTELSAGKFAKKPLVVPATMPIREVVRRIATEGAALGLRAAVVVGNGLVGLFDRKNLVKTLASNTSLDEPVEKHMTKIVCVREDAPLTDVFVLIDEYGVSGVPVCDVEGNIVGYIDVRSLVNEAMALREVTRKKIAVRVKARDAIAREPIVVRSETPLRDVARIMVENRIGYVPVVDNSKLIGGFSESDFINVVVRDIPLETAVGTVAKKDVITVSPDASLKDVAELMTKHSIRHVLIVDNEEIKGVLSVKDVLKATV